MVGHAISRLPGHTGRVRWLAALMAAAVAERSGRGPAEPLPDRATGDAQGASGPSASGSVVWKAGWACSRRT